MNPVAVIVVSVCLSAGTTAGLTYALRPAADSPTPLGTDELRAAIRRLEDEQKKLQQALAVVPASGGANKSERTVVPTISDDDIAAALQRYMSTHGAAADAAVSGGKTLDVAAAFAELRGKGNYFTNSDAWRRVFAAGKMDEMIKMFEARAAANPQDAAAHMELANAYVAYMQLDPGKMPELGMKPDQEYDRVLAIDDHNWEARFSKAVGYTFWPEFMGKKKEALVQFDRLVQQQEGMTPTDDQAQTYLFYGNLLDQSGQGDKAREIWQRGATRHPTNAELRRRLGQ
jgi:tetratricopeptide (TPR) repeat protein